MTTPPTDQQLLVSLRNAMAVEGARIEELALQFQADGRTELAEHLAKAARLLEEERDEIMRVADVALVLREVDMKLEKLRQFKLAIQIRNMRRRLTLAADVLCPPTQRMTTGEYPASGDDDDE